MAQFVELTKTLSIYSGQTIDLPPTHQLLIIYGKVQYFKIAYKLKIYKNVFIVIRGYGPLNFYETQCVGGQG